MPRIQIYTTRWCGFCVRAKTLLDSRKLPYEEISLDDDPAFRQTVFDSTGGWTVPQILVDGHFFGNAVYGLPRPDVFELSFYPGYLNVGNPGFQYALDTRLLANGEHFIDVIVTDAHGSTTYIGKKRIVVNNVGG